MDYMNFERASSNNTRLEELRSSEDSVLSQVESGGSKKKESIKNVLRVITAGVMILGASPTFAQPSELPQNTVEQKDTERKDMFIRGIEEEVLKPGKPGVWNKGYIRGLVEAAQQKKLTLGEPKGRARCPCEQYGIYFDGKHIGDIYSRGFRFDETEFKKVFLNEAENFFYFLFATKK